MDMKWIFGKKSEHDEHISFLMALPIFEKVSTRSSAFRLFLTSIEQIRVKRSTIIYSKGEKSTHLFLVRDGEVHITTGEKTPEGLIAIQRRGSLFGEVSLLNAELHTTNAISALDSTLYMIPGEAILRLMSQEPSVGQAMAKLLSRRLSNQIQSITEVPTSIFTLLYPENPARSSLFCMELAAALAVENPAPVLLISLNKSHNLKRVPEWQLSKLVERWSHITIHEIQEMVSKNSLPYHILNGSDTLNDDSDLEKLKEIISALLGLLRKYYTAILVDAGSHFDHPLLTHILRQSDKIILARSIRKKEPGKEDRWQECMRFCRETVQDHTGRILTLSDEPEEESLSLKDIQALDSYIMESSAYFRTHLRIKSCPVKDENGIEKCLLKGIERLARKLSGTSRGLVLGGGGARALAHAGALEVFEEEGIDFDSIAGTSMGAVIGAAYALGIPAQELRKLLLKILPDADSFLDKHLPFVSFYRGKKVRHLLRGFFKDLSFEDLDIPFYCTGSDLNSGRMVIFQKGPLVDALSASLSLPGIFPPLPVEEYKIVDGAVLNNLPGNILIKRGYDRIVGINVTPAVDDIPMETVNTKKGLMQGLHDYITIPPILKIISRAIAIQGNELLRFHLEDFDFVIEPSVARFDLFDFEKGEEIIRTGRVAAMESMAELKETLQRKRIKQEKFE